MGILVFDRKRTVKVVRAIATAWENGTGVFGWHVPPERRLLPPEIEVGGRRHGLFLFFTGWLNRYGRSATQVVTDAARLAVEKPYLLDPILPESRQRELFEELVDVIPLANSSNPRDKERVTWWYDSLEILRQKYDADPRQIFLALKHLEDPVRAREEVTMLMREFPGVQQKIGHLITGWFQETAWGEDTAKWERVRKIPILAVDLWLMRLVRQLDLVTDYETDVSTMIDDMISDYLCTICAEEGISHNHLGQGLWGIGTTLCGTGKRSSCIHCPVKEFCVGRVPANYIRKLGTSRRPASMQWGRLSPHHPTFDEIW